MQQKRRASKNSLLGSRFIFIKVLSDDFADVDFREELCYHSRPKKQNSKGEKRTKDECRKALRGGKSGSRSQAVQRGRLRAAAPFGLVFRVVLVAFSQRVLGCGARQRGALVYAKHTPWCQINFLLIKASKKAYKY